MTLQPPIPVLRIFDAPLAKAFYVDWLGFGVDWEGSRTDGLRYMQISRGPIELHLSEHWGDCSPGAKVFVNIDDVEALHRDLSSRPNPNMRPGGEVAPWNAKVIEVVDPFSNRLCFNQPLEAMTAGRVKAVEWKDLLHLSDVEVLQELSLSLPWLIGSWFAAAHEQYVVALGASFMFFLTGLRQVHNAYHYALGVSRNATEWVMFVLSVVMLGSMHAVQVNHLRHHRYCMSAEDVEATSARMPGWQAVLIGPLFPLRLHRKALEVATPSRRRWIWAELAANLAVVLAVFFVLEVQWLQYHVIAMLAGQCLTAFFAVWTVHHDCDPNGHFARTIRNRVKAFITYNMFYHVEHHLFPAVPTCKLPILAKRLDAVAPELATHKVF